MYFADLTPYVYTQERLADDALSLVNFGWLDAGHDYSRGRPEPKVIERCLRLAARYVTCMRGYHRCPFCKDGKQITMFLGDEPIYLGNAEIHITGGCTTYVAPSLLPHYMEAHDYMPPREVLEALQNTKV